MFFVGGTGALPGTLCVRKRVVHVDVTLNGPLSAREEALRAFLDRSEHPWHPEDAGEETANHFSEFPFSVQISSFPKFHTRPDGPQGTLGVSCRT